MNEEKRSLSLKELKAAARGQLIGKYNIAILAVLIVSVIYYIVMMIEVNVIGDSTAAYLTGVVIDVIVNLLFGVLAYGQAFFFLKLARGDKSLSFSDLFSGVKGLSDKTIILQAVFTVFSLISVIPSVLLRFGAVTVPDEYYYYFAYGVIVLQYIILFVVKLYFGLSFYLLADNKEASPLEILKRSNELMKNKKGRLFLIYLSSIPLFLLGILACGVGYLWFMVYFETLFADFYLDTIGEKPFNPAASGPTEGPSDGSPTLDIRL